MFTILEEKNLYTYDELDEKARERVVQDELNNCYYEYESIVQSYISWNMHDLENRVYDARAEKFKNALEWQYDLSCTQGSGFNFYGELFLTDIFDFMGDDIPEEKRELFDGETVVFPPNMRYTYSGWDNSLGYKYILQDRLEEIDEDIDPVAAQDFASDFCRKMDRACDDVLDDLQHFVFEGVYEAWRYEDQLFTSDGAYYGTVYDVEEVKNAG